MRSILLIGTAVLTASNVYCQTLMTGRDHAVDSDVVLESGQSDARGRRYCRKNRRQIR